VSWTRIPWRLLIDHAPTIVDAARRLYAGSHPAPLRGRPSERTTASLESLTRAVEQLEARDAQHAEVVAELVKQVQDVTTALAVLRARVRWAWVTAALALVLALLTAFLMRR
jgi:hypothetical protein